ncbi:MAG: helix-turn-helix transcriptional regulator [Caulobacter sp.]|nr:helix-turn-helix transcriptional regulator [Caulobacter sp.]
MAGGKARPWVTSASYEAAIRQLVAVRKRMGLSQRELAERLGKPRSFVSKVENRERRIDLIELIALARGLGVDPGALVTEIAEAVPDPLEF